MTRRRSLVGIALLVVLAGCTDWTGETYRRPDLPVPDTFRQDVTATGTGRPSSATWWKDFGEPRLDAFVERALAQNSNLLLAGLAARKAWLQAGIAADRRRPQLSASVQVARSEQLSAGNSQLVATDSGALAPVSGSGTSRSGSASLEASWEADLWGRLATKEDIARLEAEASEQDRRAAALSLTGNVVRLYWQAAYLSERIALADEEIAYAAKTLALTRAKRQAGQTGALDEAEAERTLHSQEATLEPYLLQQRQTLNALALLEGVAPGAAEPDIGALPNAPPAPPPTGLPASLLERRPDLMAAELRLKESLAGIDAERTSYLPTLSLTGTLGSSSASLVRLLDNPVGTLGAGLTLPFLQWNQMQLSVASARTDYRKAAVTFRQTFLVALEEVDNALASEQHYRQEGEKLSAAWGSADRASKLTRIRLDAGKIELQTWLDADEKRRSARENLLQNRYDLLSARVALQLALGGGTE